MKSKTMDKYKIVITQIQHNYLKRWKKKCQEFNNWY